ncbi:MAG TPA: hypothetical protein VEI07_25545, partial [Planctomycetaceae bacterium]|nr:hypothetical protein [Planctomycetaceae bacterium]
MAASLEVSGAEGVFAGAVAVAVSGAGDLAGGAASLEAGFWAAETQVMSTTPAAARAIRRQILA